VHHAGGESGTLSISIPQIPGASASLQSSFPTAGDHFPELVLQLSYSQLELWWPVGYGQARLYNLTASYQAGGSVACCSEGMEGGQEGQEGQHCDGQCSRQTRWVGRSCTACVDGCLCGCCAWAC
jgi:hypothetical protein